MNWNKHCIKIVKSELYGPKEALNWIHVIFMTYVQVILDPYLVEC